MPAWTDLQVVELALEPREEKVAAERVDDDIEVNESCAGIEVSVVEGFAESVDDDEMEVSVAVTGSTEVRAEAAVEVTAAESASLLLVVVAAAMLLLTAMVMPVSLSTTSVCVLPCRVCAERVAPVPSII